MHALSPEPTAFYLVVGSEGSPLEPLAFMATLAEIYGEIQSSVALRLGRPRRFGVGFLGTLGFGVAVVGLTTARSSRSAPLYCKRKGSLAFATHRSLNGFSNEL